MIITSVLALLLAQAAPAKLAEVQPPPAPIVSTVELRSMTNEDRLFYPGRERFDKTEWYEIQQKTVQTVIVPTQVDEWENCGLDYSAIETATMHGS